MHGHILCLSGRREEEEERKKTNEIRTKHTENENENERAFCLHKQFSKHVLIILLLIDDRHRTKRERTPSK